MDDMTEKLQALLSDPESLRNLQELSAMMQQGDDTSQAETAAGDADAPMPDIGKIMAAGQVLSHLEDDANIALLRALKPHLSDDRGRRAEQAISFLRLYGAASALREQGMLDDLLHL